MRAIFVLALIALGLIALPALASPLDDLSCVVSGPGLQATKITKREPSPAGFDQYVGVYAGLEVRISAPDTTVTMVSIQDPDTGAGVMTGIPREMGSVRFSTGAGRALLFLVCEGK